MNKEDAPHVLRTISELHRYQGLPLPKHPMVSVFRLHEAPETHVRRVGSIIIGHYCIAIKKNYGGKFKYGQRFYDYDSGVMSFFSPNQKLTHLEGEAEAVEGIVLSFHPDFLAGYPLARTIRNYGFFSYELSEALHLSEQEEEILDGIFCNIEREYESNIDRFSQDVMIAQIELLLQYSNRFYNRQFITRKPANDEMLIRLEHLLDGLFNEEHLSQTGIPTVQQVAEQLHVSPNYLSDLLRSTTGQTTQQHIHNKLIEKAKELLSTTTLSVSEIAFMLGFAYPQSFNKLFRNKTNASPLAYRQSFN